MSKTNEIQIADKVLDHVVSMNKSLLGSADTILDGFNKLKELTDIPNKKTILEAGLTAKGMAIADVQSEVVALKNIADYIKSHVSGLVEL